MHIVVPFNRGQALGKECDWVPFPVVFQELFAGPPPDAKLELSDLIRKRLMIVREHEYGGTDNPLLQLFKCHIAFRGPAERHILLGEVKEQTHNLRESFDEPSVRSLRIQGRIEPPSSPEAVAIPLPQLP